METRSTVQIINERKKRLNELRSQLENINTQIAERNAAVSRREGLLKTVGHNTRDVLNLKLDEDKKELERLLEEKGKIEKEIKPKSLKARHRVQYVTESILAKVKSAITSRRKTSVVPAESPREEHADVPVLPEGDVQESDSERM